MQPARSKARMAGDTIWSAGPRRPPTTWVRGCHYVARDLVAAGAHRVPLAPASMGALAMQAPRACAQLAACCSWCKAVGYPRVLRLLPAASSFVCFFFRATPALNLSLRAECPLPTHTNFRRLRCSCALLVPVKLLLLFLLLLLLLFQALTWGIRPCRTPWAWESTACRRGVEAVGCLRQTVVHMMG